MPWGALGMVLLIVGVEVFVFHHRMFLPLPAAEHQFAAGAAREARRYQILCFGDSQMKDALVPQVVRARLGKRTLNLAIAGSPPHTAYFLLRRVLESGARPEALLVDYHAWVLQCDPRYRLLVYADFCNFREIFDLARTARDPSFFGLLVVSRYLPSFRLRSEIRADVMAALFEKPPSDRQRGVVFISRRNWMQNGGAQLMARNPEVTKIAEFWDESASYLEKWRCFPTNARYVAKFLKLASDHAIPVFLLIPPRHPRVQANRERLGLDALYTRYLREAAEGYANVTILDARQSGYDPGVFIDSSHFDRQGACDFSDDVAAAVADRLAGENPRGTGPCWVNLPAHRSRPEPIGLEDLTQSEAALTSNARVLRR
jgi:hypothetical protein